jgi:hypothetical protein
LENYNAERVTVLCADAVRLCSLFLLKQGVDSYYTIQFKKSDAALAKLEKSKEAKVRAETLPVFSGLALNPGSCSALSLSLCCISPTVG